MLVHQKKKKKPNTGESKLKIVFCFQAFYYLSQKNILYWLMLLEKIFLYTYVYGIYKYSVYTFPHWFSEDHIYTSK